MSEHDDLLRRLRAADPAAEREGRIDVPAATAERGRAALLAARRRRTVRRRARTGAASCGLAAFLGALALGFSGGGGEGGPVRAGLPGLDGIVAAAAHAADPPNGRIVELTTVLRVSSHDVGGRRPYRSVWRSTRWVRLDRRGRVLQHRLLVHDGRSAGQDSASYRSAGSWWTDSWAPAADRAGRWRLRRTRSRLVAESLTLNAARILRRAQAGRGPHLELLGRVAVGGRPAYRLRIDSIEEPPLHHGYKELFVDARTYAPVKRSERRWGIAVSGREYVSASEEVVESRRVLEDTAANRRLLDVRGPTR